jgi:hypothetical protein
VRGRLIAAFTLPAPAASTLGWNLHRPAVAGVTEINP